MHGTQRDLHLSLAGDAFNMRHPLTGGGMTVALSDAALLSDMLEPLPSFADQLTTADRTAAFYTKRKPLSATINTLANALYRVGISHLLTVNNDPPRQGTNCSVCLKVELLWVVVAITMSRHMPCILEARRHNLWRSACGRCSVTQETRLTRKCARRALTTCGSVAFTRPAPSAFCRA